MSDNRSRWELLRLVTPIMVTLVGVYVGYTTHLIERTQGSIVMGIKDVQTEIKDVRAELSAQISTLDNKVFKHLTNDEIHMPRTQALDKDEFILQEKYNDRQIAQIMAAIDQLRSEVRESRKK